MIKRSTRRGSHFFIVLFFLIITILLHRSRYLIGLLFENGSTDTVYPSTPSSSSELEPNNTTTTQMIPKIIHQTYSSEDLPAHWRDAQQAVKAFYPDYDYMVGLPRFLSRLVLIEIQSSGPVTLPFYSSAHTTHGFSTHTRPIHILSSEPTLSDTFSSTTTAAYTSTSYCTLSFLQSTPPIPCFSHALPAPRASPTMCSGLFLHSFHKLVIINLNRYNRNWEASILAPSYMASQRCICGVIT